MRSDAECGKSLGKVLQALDVSEATYHCWLNQYGEMQTDKARRLPELDSQNASLKTVLAEAEREKDILKDVTSGHWQSCPESTIGHSRPGAFDSLSASSAAHSGAALEYAAAREGGTISRRTSTKVDVLESFRTHQ
jgi:putative transposase